MKEIRYVLERQLDESGAEELNKLGEDALAAIRTGKVKLENKEAHERTVSVLEKRYAEGDWVTMGEFKKYPVAKQERNKRSEHNRRNKKFEKLRIVKAEFDAVTREYEIVPW